MWGETCRWAAILSDPALVSVVYIAVKIPWDDGYRNIWRGNGNTLHRSLLTYLEGQWEYPSQIYLHPVVPHLVLYSVPGTYSSYDPWPHVPPHVLVVVLWALLLCYASR